MFDAGDATATDPIEHQSSRPDFLILSYPVITMEDPYVHKGSAAVFLGDAPTQAEMDAMSPEQHVTAQTPPHSVYDDRRSYGSGAEQRDVLYGAGEGRRAGGDAHLPAWGAWVGTGGDESATAAVDRVADRVDARAWIRGGSVEPGGGNLRFAYGWECRLAEELRQGLRGALCWTSHCETMS